MPVFAGMEHMSIGQVRYIITGSRSVKLAHYSELKEALQKMSIVAETAADVAAGFRNLTSEQIADILVKQTVQLYSVKQGPNETLYVPPMMVVVEKVFSEALGLRLAVFPKTGEIVDEYCEYVKTMSQSLPVYSKMKALAMWMNVSVNGST